MNMISIDQFVAQKKLKFESEKSKIAWFKRLRAESFVKLGVTYFINEGEAEQLLGEELARKIKIKKKRSNQARINFKLNRKPKRLPKREEVS
jgi:hypothetical protein